MYVGYSKRGSICIPQPGLTFTELNKIIYATEGRVRLCYIIKHFKSSAEYIFFV